MFILGSTLVVRVCVFQVLEKLDNKRCFYMNILLLHLDNYGFVDGLLISIVPNRINHIECLPLQEMYFTCP